MAKECQRKKKLVQLIKDFVLTETTNKNRVPEIISDYILGEYGLKHNADVKGLPDEEGTDFIFKLEDFMKEKYKTHEGEVESDPNEVNHKHRFIKSCDGFATAKSEYFQTTIRMNSLLHEVIQLKEKYSEHLKEKSSEKKGELEVLEKKLHCLKLQFFLKFYSENNALDALLHLKEILTERLKLLQSQYNNLVDLVAKYNELKTNKSYTELFQLYKQLLKKEKKIDYMIEN